MAGEILTIRELPGLVKIGEKTAYVLAENGELPGFKLRDQWRFRRADIDAWVDRRVRRHGDTEPEAEPEGRS